MLSAALMSISISLCRGAFYIDGILFADKIAFGFPWCQPFLSRLQLPFKLRTGLQGLSCQICPERGLSDIHPQGSDFPRKNRCASS